MSTCYTGTITSQYENLTRNQSKEPSLAMTHGSMHVEREFSLAMTHESKYALEVRIHNLEEGMVKSPSTQ